jgi:hypothetical protein
MAQRQLDRRVDRLAARRRGIPGDQDPPDLALPFGLALAVRSVAGRS